jgi:hypothetical protein
MLTIRSMFARRFEVRFFRCPPTSPSFSLELTRTRSEFSSELDELLDRTCDQSGLLARATSISEFSYTSLSSKMMRSSALSRSKLETTSYFLGLRSKLCEVFKEELIVFFLFTKLLFLYSTNSKIFKMSSFSILSKTSQNGND